MSDPAKVKVRVIDFELSGSDDAVRDSIRTLTAAFSPQAALPPPAPVIRAAPSPVLELPAPARLEPIAETPPERTAVHRRKAAPRVAGEQRQCANPTCGASFTPKRANTTVCKKVACKKWKLAQYAKESYARKHPNAAKPAVASAGRRMFTRPGPPVDPPSAPLPPESSHGPGFSMSELHGLGQAEALAHWAKRHHNLLDVSTAVPMLQASGVFGNGNAAAVRNRILNLIDTLPAFTSTEAPLVFELNP